MEDFFFTIAFQLGLGQNPNLSSPIPGGQTLRGFEGLRKTTDLCWGKEGRGWDRINISLKTRFNVAQRCISSVW